MTTATKETQDVKATQFTAEVKINGKVEISAITTFARKLATMKQVRAKIRALGLTIQKADSVKDSQEGEMAKKLITFEDVEVTIPEKKAKASSTKMKPIASEVQEIIGIVTSGETKETRQEEILKYNRHQIKGACDQMEVGQDLPKRATKKAMIEALLAN